MSNYNPLPKKRKRLWIRPVRSNPFLQENMGLKQGLNKEKLPYLYLVSLADINKNMDVFLNNGLFAKTV